MNVMKVRSKSVPQKVAGAIANLFREDVKQVEIQVVGAGALNQAIKAIAIARGYIVASGINIVCVPSFSDIIIDGEERTSIKLLIEAI